MPTDMRFTISVMLMRLARRLCSITAGSTSKRRLPRPMLSFERLDGSILFLTYVVMSLSCQSPKTHPYPNVDAMSVKLNSPPRSMKSPEHRAHSLPKVTPRLGYVINATSVQYNNRLQLSIPLLQNSWLYPSDIVFRLLL